MVQTLTKIRYVVFGILVFAVFAGRADAGQRVRVALTDGTQLVAEVDERTDGDRLWLRFTGITAVALRPVSWNKVVSVSVLAPRHFAETHPARSTGTRASHTDGITFARQAQQALGDSQPVVTSEQDR